MKLTNTLNRLGARRSTLISVLALASAYANASVTFTATFDHWSYTTTGDSSRVTLSSTNGTSPTFSASSDVWALPMGGDNPDSDDVSAYVDVYAVYNVTATKTTGDPFSGITRIAFEESLTASSSASTKGLGTSAYTRLLGLPVYGAGIDQICESYDGGGTDTENYGTAWGGGNSLLVSMTQTSSTTWQGQIGIHAGEFVFTQWANAPTYSYKEGQAGALGTFGFRNVYATYGN